MRIHRNVAFGVLTALAVLSLPLCARADELVFGLDQSQTPTTFAANSGVAQGVFVDTTTTIDSFGFFFDQKGGGDVDYAIYDATTGTFALDPTSVVAPVGSKDWAYLTGLSLTLDAGDTYYFAIFGDNTTSVGLDPTVFTGIGLSIAPQNYTFTVSSIVPPDFTYSPLSGTANADGLSTDDVSLRVYAVTPEPASLVLLGTGLLALAGFARKRFTA